MNPDTITLKSDMEFDVPNRNGRIYPKGVMEAAIKDFQDKIKSGTAVGFLGPDEPLSNREPSHKITSLKTLDNSYETAIQILNTESGRLLISLLDNKDIKMGASISGTGKILNNKINSLKLNHINIKKL